MPDLTTPTYRIGVDGGGTKTELILVDAAGAVVAAHTAAGCNPSQVGPEKSRNILLKALQVLCPRLPAGSVQSTLLFVAGSPDTWREISTGLTGFGMIKIAADSLPVLELATAGAPGLVVHAGTGSFVAARAPDGSIHYAGGLGWKIGDAGSGFDLGRRGVALALLELLGWAQPTPLGTALKAHTGLADYAANSRFFYNNPTANTIIAGFAPCILALAGEGHVPAQAILTASLAELVGQARLVTTKLFGDATVPCGVSGALLNTAPAATVLRDLVTAHHWPVALNFITTPPIEGVRRLLAGPAGKT
jgi:N-acetylglucosamine kinase-like BadF-type ATPase